MQPRNALVGRTIATTSGAAAGVSSVIGHEPLILLGYAGGIIIGGAAIGCST